MPRWSEKAKLAFIRRGWSLLECLPGTTRLVVWLGWEWSVSTRVNDAYFELCRTRNMLVMIQNVDSWTL